MAYFFQLPLITDLTEDQQMALDEVNPIAISGGAGTGKTVVSLWRHIQNMETLNKYSVLVTYTKTLGHYLSMSIRGIENHTKYQSENIEPPSSQVFILKTFPFTQNWKVYEIIIDEAQDLTFSKLQEIQNYGEHTSYGADFNQKLYTETIKEDEIKNLFTNNIEYNLQQNFRNSYHILNFAKAILPNFYIPQNTLDELEDKNIGLQPIMFISDDFEKEIEKIIELINEFKSDTHNIAILLPFGKDTFSNGQQVKDSVDNYYKVLSSKNIDCSRYFNEMKTDNIEISNIHITTYKSVKGLEFDTVIIPFMNKFQDYILKDSFPTVVNEEDYYVAFTRTKTNLYLLSSEKLDFIDNSICEIEFLENNHYNKPDSLAQNIDNEIPF
jgi:DNA helicase IV